MGYRAVLAESRDCACCISCPLLLHEVCCKVTPNPIEWQACVSPSGDLLLRKKHVLLPGTCEILVASNDIVDSLRSFRSPRSPLSEHSTILQPLSQSTRSDTAALTCYVTDAMEDDDMDVSLDGGMSKRAVSCQPWTSPELAESGAPTDDLTVRQLSDAQDTLRSYRTVFQL